MGIACQLHPQNVWHHTTIDHRELIVVAHLRQNVRIVTCPQFRGRVVYKFAPLPRLIGRVEKETFAYGAITLARGTRQRFWAPRFLAHVAEEGRVIGFLMEYINGRQPQGAGDFTTCSKAVEGLHGVNVDSPMGKVPLCYSGGMHMENFIIRTVIRNGRNVDEAVLIDFSRTSMLVDE